MPTPGWKSDAGPSYVFLFVQAGEWLPESLSKGTKPRNTAFITPLWLFKFNHMTFRLSNALSTFQCLIEGCLGDLNVETVLVYPDDIIIFSKSFEDHI